jgi:hypothetical protein
MRPRRPVAHKPRNDYPDRKQQRLLSVRSALITTMSLLAAVGGAGLLSAAHQADAMIVLTAVGIFAGALRLLNDLID